MPGYENTNCSNIESASEKLGLLENEIKKVIIGQEDVISELLTAFAAGGHVLLEGVPGIAKTLLIKTLAGCTHCTYKRLQFTPDMMPADITGTKIYKHEKSSFETVKGPVFSNIVMADEINRAPPKVQSALLEAMQERQVTIQGDTFPIELPFFVLATQNPIESEGTYPLPEAQTDRFMAKILMDYPSKEDEIRIIQKFTVNREPGTGNTIEKEDITAIRTLVRTVFTDEAVERYTADIIDATRHPDNYGLDCGRYIEFGASPRASINLILCAKARALIKKRKYVIPDDIREMAHPVLRHRIILNYEALAEGIREDEIIDSILEKVKNP